MTDYRVGVGHDQALATLTVLSPQPRSPGLQATQRIASASGAVHEHGLFIVFEFDYSETEAEYLALLTLFGIHNNSTGLVTIYARNRTFQYARYNGTAIQPLANDGVRRQDFFLRDLRILVRDLTQL